MIVLLEAIDKLCDKVSKGSYDEEIKDLIFSHKVHAGHCMDCEWKKASEDFAGISLQELDMRATEDVEGFKGNYMKLLESLYANMIYLLKMKESKMVHKHFDSVLQLWKNTILIVYQLWNISALLQSEDSEKEDTASITATCIVMFIVQNAAATIIYHSIQYMNELLMQDSLTSKKLTQLLDSNLLTDTIGCNLLLRGSCHSITTDIQSFLTPSIHEHSFLLQNSSSFPSLYSTDTMLNNVIASSLLPPTITSPILHPAYFYQLLQLHDGVSHDLSEFYKAIQDEISILLQSGYQRQHPQTLKPSSRKPREEVREATATSEASQVSKKAYLEGVMTKVYIALTKYWDSSNQQIQSAAATSSLNPVTFFDTLVAHAILLSLATDTWQWRDPRTNMLESSLLIQPSGLVSIIAIATKLADTYQESSISLGLILFYQVFQCASSSTLMSVVEWIFPKLFQIHSIVSEDRNKLYAHRIVQLMLTIQSKSGFSIQYQHKYLSSLLKDLMNEHQPMKAWIALVCLQSCLVWYPHIICASHFSDLIHVHLHTSNLWHLSIQKLTVKNVQLLFSRFPSAMTFHIVPLLTEYFRMLLFYSQRLMADITNSSDEERTAFGEEIVMAIRSIRDNFPVEYKEWYLALEHSAASNHLKGNNSSTPKNNSHQGSTDTAKIIAQLLVSI